MMQRIALWQRFLRCVLAIVLSVQFVGIAPLVVLAMGCMSPEVPESAQVTTPKAHRTKICVMPSSLPPETKVFATDASRSEFVSDRDADAFRKFLPLADGDARPLNWKRST